MFNTKLLLLSLILVLVITLSVLFILKDNIKLELFENNVIPNELINEREQLKDTDYITMSDISSGINTNKVDTQNLNVLDTIKSKNINTNKLTSTDYIIGNNIEGKTVIGNNNICIGDICLDKTKFQELSNFDKNAISGNSMNITKELNIRGGNSVHNPKGLWTYFPWRGNGKNYIRGDTEMRGNVDNIGDLTVGGKIKFGPMDNDPYSIQKVVTSPDNATLRLTINDNWNEAFEIWGDACGTGNCGSQGTQKHRFVANGDAEHKGNLTVGGTLNVNRINIGTRWTISQEGKNQVLVIRDNLSGGDKRFAFYPNQYKDI